MSETGIADEFADELVTTCRTGVGDTLRSVIYFTPKEFDLLYLRSDLYGGQQSSSTGIETRLRRQQRLGFETNKRMDDSRNGVGNRRSVSTDSPFVRSRTVSSVALSSASTAFC
uniref:DUF7522 family protein n=1 Tax=Haladaptatus caseinilyticus TaxID=2993314 RepID=UPI00224A5A49|nr:hypothetical protein [Haladaptatus caseinilyticus]